jgi:hypothetical protein
MIDPPSRSRLVNAINRYMDEEITAFAFDDEIHQIGHATKDATVDFVVSSLWYHYDDCKDHLAGLAKEEWDYFQRLILLLESNAEIDFVSQRRWSVRQIVAAVALAGFGLCVAWLGGGWHLLAVSIAFGPISIGLSYWRRALAPQPTRPQLGLVPFSSFSELRAVRKAASGFAKRRYPRHARIRNVHGPLATMAAWMNLFILWSLGSPLVLLLQALPEKETTIRFREGAA